MATGAVGEDLMFTESKVAQTRLAWYDMPF